MKGFEPERILGFFVGAGAVYLFWTILDLLIDKTFDPVFFFVYWNLMMVMMIGSGFAIRQRWKLDQEEEISSSRKV